MYYVYVPVYTSDYLYIISDCFLYIRHTSVIICSKALPIDRCHHREKGQPLCMAQYYRLFSSYREPGLYKDKLTTVEGDPNRQHITVIRNNQVYKMS